MSNIHSNPLPLIFQANIIFNQSIIIHKKSKKLRLPSIPPSLNTKKCLIIFFYYKLMLILQQLLSPHSINLHFIEQLNFPNNNLNQSSLCG